MFYPVILYLLEMTILVMKWLSFVILTILLIIRMNVVSSYKLDYVFSMHGRLSHIGISTKKRLVKCGMINCNIGELNKYKICIKSKMTRQLFLSVERNTNLFDFVYGDICELIGMLTRDCNRTFL